MSGGQKDQLAGSTRLQLSEGDRIRVYRDNRERACVCNLTKSLHKLEDLVCFRK